MSSKRPAPIYVKPPLVPATAAVFDELRERMADPDPVGRALDEEREALCAYLSTQGIRVVKRVPYRGPQPGMTFASVDGGHVCYRKADHHPTVIEAVEALAAIERVRRAKGERRVLAAVALGEALERTRATAHFARKVSSKTRQETVLREKRYAAPMKADPRTIIDVLQSATSNKQAARILGVSPRTITTYRKKYAQV